MAKMRFNKNFNINRVVKRLVYTILALYVGGTILVIFGNVMNGTHSVFYQGLSLIGWTVGTVTNASTSLNTCGNDFCGTTNCASQANCITATNGAGVLAVVGIIGIASVVMEFITFG